MRPQVTFRGIFPSQAVVDAVWHRARALATFAPELERCPVIVERLTREGEANTRFRVSLLLSGNASLQTADAPPHSVTAIDVHLALRDLFAQARRRFTQPWLLPKSPTTRLGVQH